MTLHHEAPQWESTALPSGTPLLFVGLLLFLGVTGCKINYEANTVVAPDGSVTRTTRYVADEASDKKRLESEYVLPAGGIWGTQKATKYNWRTKKEYEGTAHTYTVTEKYALGEPIASDHIRKGEREGRVAKNETLLSVKDYFFVKVFDFRETFRDIGSKERAIASAQRLYPVWVGQFADGLQSRLEGVDSSQANQVLREMFDPWFNKFIESFEAGDEDFFEKHEEELNEVSEKDQLVEKLMVQLPPPSEEQAESWQEAIAEAYDEMETESEGLWEDEEFEEAFFGVYGFTLFEYYGFKETVSLPGQLVSTNATSRDGDTLTWEFGRSDFRWEDYVLEAQSRIVYRGRMVGAGIAFLVLIVVLGGLSGRRKRQT